MTQKEKAKKDKVEKLKKSAFKFLHIIGYISTAFIILLIIISCVKGCSSKRQNRSDSIISQPNQLINYSQNQQYYTFNFDLDSSVVIDLATQRNLLPYSTSGIFTFEGDFEFTYSSPTIVSFNVEYQEYYQSGTLILDVYFLDDADSKYRVAYKQDDESPQAYQDFNYDTFYVDSVFYNGSSLIRDDLFLYFFSLDEGTNFTFNQSFNYNAPMGLSITSPYGAGANWTQSTAYTAHLDIYTGWFVSNGKLYDTIQYWCTSAGDSDFEVTSYNGTTNISQGQQGQWGYLFMYYKNSVTGDDDIVNYRNQVAYTKSGGVGAYYYQNSSTWRNAQFRYIKFLEPLSDSNRFLIDSFNNNNLGAYSGSINGNGNVFVLLGSAFSELLPFLNIMILPNISIGVLLFLPLIVGIVVILFHILKK